MQELDLDVEDVLEWLPIDEKVRASQVVYIHWEDWYTPIKWKDYFDGKDWKDGKDWEHWYTPIKWVDYDDWKDYVLTKEDREQIAKQIEVPIVEKIIEIETIIEKPIVTNEIREIAMHESAEDIVKKINSLVLEDEYKIDASHIKNLPMFMGGGKRFALNGVPAWWAIWEVLKKRSGADYDLEWGTWWGGWGDVVWPASSINNRVVFFDWITGKLIKDSWLTLSWTNTGDQDLSPYFNKSVDDTDDITVGATNKFATTAEKTKLWYISVTQSVDLDTLESDTATNNAKVTNATHTGEMTGATTLTADPTLVSNKTLKSTLSWAEEVLINDAWTLKKTTAQDIADLGGWGGGWSQPYTALSTDTTITQGNVYWVTASAVDITLTLTDGTTAGQTLTVKKLDSTDYTVTIANASIDWETSIELTIEDESVDLYRTGTAFIIK